MNNFKNIEEIKKYGGNIPQNSIINADCLDAMKFIADESISLILADLPYGTTKAQFDCIINLDDLWKEYKRIIKPNGAILLFAQTPFDKILGASNISMLKYEWIWEKTQATGFLNAKKAPLKAHENILVFYKKAPIYNPQKTTGHKPINSYTKRANVQNKTELYGNVKSDISGGGDTDRYPRSVLIFPSDKQIMKNTPFLHPMQKPLALCEYFIKTYTNEGDLVLDNVCGSGTTGVAAKKLNRNYILIEKEERFYKMTVERIQTIKVDSTPEIAILFEKLFSDINMKEKNKILILFLNKHITNSNFFILNKFLENDLLENFEPSLLKSILIFIENVSSLEQYVIEIKKYLDKKIAN